MNCKECTKRRCPSFGSSEKCNVCLYTGGDYLEVRDWLADVAQPQAGEAFDCVEVRFKNGRKGFYRNVNRLPLSAGDIVAVESSPGHDIGCVMLTGQLARLQMRRKKEDPSSPELRKVYRLATQKDIDVWQTAIAREQKTLVRTREICDNLGLVMKLSDVEYQGDNLKATFYYTADGRVDFRQLIKELASAFGVRIEMRQIGLRQEAARVGGIGSCGRELCCTTWLTDFRSVNTSAARTQRLSLNPQKLAGQCGKLKCCLNFELDVYVDALKGFPPTDAVLRTEKGVAHFQKMDVFKGIYWYAYDFEAMNWIGLHVDAVAEIQQANRRGEKPESLEMYVEESERPRSGSRREETSELQAVEEGEITRFDKVSSRRSRRRGDRRREDRRRESVPEVKNGAKESARQLHEIIAKMKANGGVHARFELHEQLTIRSDRLTPGETLRVHLPMPIVGAQVKSAALLGASHPVAFLAPEDEPQRTIYFELPYQPGMTVSADVAYEIDAPYQQPHARDVYAEQPVFDTEEQPPHVVFTPYLRALAKEIVGDETNALLKARKIYDFITTQAVYRFMPPYLTVTNIPEYFLSGLRGDCGVQAITFVTLCRLCGVPAQWQSGLYTKPDSAGHHDWARFYVAPFGWLFADCSFGGSAYRAGDLDRWNFYFGNLEPWRMPTCSAFQQEFNPPRRFLRYDPYDNQSGDVESLTRRLYADEYEHDCRVLRYEEME